MPVGPLDEAQASRLSEKLLSIEGVAEAHIIREDEVAYLKVDLTRVDQESLDAYAVQG